MHAILNALRRMFRTASRPSAPRGAPLRLEALEDRCVPSTTITNPSSFPALAIVAIHTDWSNGTSSEGTGAMVGPNVVLTAGHMLYDPARGHAVDSYVFADTIGLTGSVTWSTGAQWDTFNSYVNDVNWQLAQKNVDSDGDPRHDYGDGDIALIWLNAPIGNTTGWFGLGSTDPYNWTNAYLNTMGYPGAGNNGWQLTDQYGQINGSTNEGTYQGNSYPYISTFNIFPFSSFYFDQSSIQVEPGQSGSPMFAYNSSTQSATIYGVIDIASEDGATGYAEQITGPVLNDLETWMANNNSGSSGDGHQEAETRPSSALPTQTTVQASAPNPVSYGVPVTFTAYVSAPGMPTPTTGTVKFYDNGTALGTVSLEGGFAAQASASFTASALAVGNHTITAVYSGGGGYQSSTSAAITGTVTVGITFVGLQSSINATTVGQSVTFTAGVGGAGSIPTGIVTFFDGVTVLGTAQLTQHTTGLFEDAYTTFTTSALGVGSHTITAAYGGDSNQQSGVSAAVTVTVAAPPIYGVSAAPGAGVMRYDSATGWRQLTPADASQVAVDSRGDVIAEISGYGVWRYEDAAGWRQLTPADASLVGIADDGVVAAEIPGYGVWRYEAAVGWQQLTPADASQLAVAGNGIVAVEISGYGVWRYEDAAGWRQLTPANASQVAVDANGDVAAELSGYGVWRFEDAAGWRQLTTTDASQISIAGNGIVAVELPGYGVWRFEDASGWEQLTPANASQVAVDANGDVAADLNGAGVWLFQDGLDWGQLTAANALDIGLAD